MSAASQDTTLAGADMSVTVENLPPAFGNDAFYASLKNVTVHCVDRVSLSLSTVRLIDIPHRVAFGYDITFVDEEKKYFGRGMLHPDLSVLVETEAICQGTKLAILHAKYLTHTHSLFKTTRSGLLINTVQILGFDETIGFEPSSLSWTDARRLAPLLPTQHLQRRPLFARRSHYLPMLSDDAMATVHSWQEAVKAIKLARITFATAPLGADRLAETMDDSADGVPHLYYPPERPTLQDVVTDAHLDGTGRRKRPRSQISNSANLSQLSSSVGIGQILADRTDAESAGRGAETPLVGRLCAVSSLFHFGSTGSDVDYPMKFSFRIADESRVLEVTAWNKAAAFYHSTLMLLPLGTLIAVTGYRIKIWNNNHEASINEANPRGRIFFISETYATGFNGNRLDAAGELVPRFPSLDLGFLTSAQMPVVKDGHQCSLIGIVSRLGPVCVHTQNDIHSGKEESAGASAHAAAESSIRRVKSLLSTAADQTSGTSSRYMYRWVWVRDHKSLTEVAVKLFCNSRWDSFTSLQPGITLMATHLTVVRSAWETDGSSYDAGSGAPESTAIASTMQSFFCVSTRWTSICVVDGRTAPVLKSAVNELGQATVGRLASWNSAVRSYLAFYNHIVHTPHDWFRMNTSRNAIIADAEWPYRSSICRPSSVAHYEHLFSQLTSSGSPAAIMLSVDEVQKLREDSTSFFQALAAAPTSSRTKMLLSSGDKGRLERSGGEDGVEYIRALETTHFPIVPNRIFHVMIIGKIKGFDKILPVLPQMPTTTTTKPAPNRPLKKKSVLNELDTWNMGKLDVAAPRTLRNGRKFAFDAERKDESASSKGADGKQDTDAALTVRKLRNGRQLTVPNGSSRENAREVEEHETKLSVRTLRSGRQLAIPGSSASHNDDEDKATKVTSKHERGAPASAATGKSAKPTAQSTAKAVTEVGISLAYVRDTLHDDPLDPLDDFGTPVSVYAGAFESPEFRALASKHMESYSDRQQVLPVWSVTIRDVASDSEAVFVLHPSAALPHAEDPLNADSDAASIDMDAIRAFLPPTAPSDPEQLAAWLAADMAIGTVYAFGATIQLRSDAFHGKPVTTLLTRKPIVRINAIYRLPAETAASS